MNADGAPTPLPEGMIAPCGALMVFVLPWRDMSSGQRDLARQWIVRELRAGNLDVNSILEDALSTPIDPEKAAYEASRSILRI